MLGDARSRVMQMLVRVTIEDQTDDNGQRLEED